MDTLLPNASFQSWHQFWQTINRLAEAGIFRIFALAVGNGIPIDTGILEIRNSNKLRSYGCRGGRCGESILRAFSEVREGYENLASMGQYFENERSSSSNHSLGPGLLK